MIKNDLTINYGSTFLISDLKGDIEAEDYYGLFYEDVRHLSKFKLLLDKNYIEVLTSHEVAFNKSTVVASSQSPGQNAISVIRKRIIEEGFHEDIVLVNNTASVLPVSLEIHFGTDFADIFEVKFCSHRENCRLPLKNLIKKSFNKRLNQLTFFYEKDDYKRATNIYFTQSCKMKNDTAKFSVTLKPKENWKLCVLISFEANNKKASASKNCPQTSSDEEKQYKKNLLNILDAWEWSTPKLETDWDDLLHIYTTSIFDLAALRLHGKETTGKHTDLPAAGRPWYMAVFGRDSIITAYQTILFGDALAHGALQTLAFYQGKKINPETEEQPGKILHEMRFGEMAHFGRWVKFPYFGTTDATPLFLILLSEMYLWGGNERFIKGMKEYALGALEWIDNFGDVDQDVFVEYQRMSPMGLVNQNWRDSWDSMVFEDGRYAQTPIASADIQGYVYDAKIRIAQIARIVWKDEKLAQKLESEAKVLKEKFNKEFWIQDKGYFALGLDKDKKKIDSLASSNGHLLWSGIVADEKAAIVVKSLLSPGLYSGWGVRTIGSDSRGFNPLIYHRGTVWPHDNSIVVAGMIKAGFKNQAIKIIQDMIAASTFFDYHLPEVFAGFDRKTASFPVQYPASSSPQAWAAATPILFLRLLLGIEPDPVSKTLRINPILPEGINRISLDGIAAFGKYFLIEVTPKESKITEVKEWMCHICNIKVKLGHRHIQK